MPLGPYGFLPLAERADYFGDRTVVQVADERAVSRDKKPRPLPQGQLTAMARPRILVIEDERALTDVLAYNLQREGYEVVVAHDGQEGLRKARKLVEQDNVDILLGVLSSAIGYAMKEYAARARKVWITTGAAAAMAPIDRPSATGRSTRRTSRRAPARGEPSRRGHATAAERRRRRPRSRREAAPPRPACARRRRARPRAAASRARAAPPARRLARKTRETRRARGPGPGRRGGARPRR